MQKLKLFIVAIFILSLTNCVSTPKKRAPTKAPPAAAKLYSSATSDLASNNKARALKKLEKLINDYPGSDLSMDARLLRGDIYFKAKKYEDAYDNFIAVVKSDVFSPKEFEATVWAAKSLNMLGRWDESAQLLNQAAKWEHTTKEQLITIYELKVDIHKQLGEKVESIRALVKLEELFDDPTKREQARIKANSALDSSVDIKQLDYIAGEPEFRFLRAQAMYNLGVYYIEDRNYSSARDYFLNIVDLFPNDPLVEKAKSYLDQINARRVVNSKTIGAVLPLSGKYAKIGLRTLHGLQLGLGLYGQKKSDYQLAVIDSEGNPDTARRAVERLVTEDHVIAIVGSLLSKTAMAVASKAHELGVPSIALSQKVGLREVGDTVFRNATTSEMYVRHLVKVAMEDYNINRFAVLYPNDPYGVEYANIFWDEVLRRNGQVNGAQPYQRTETDFKGHIQRLVGTFYVEDRIDEYKLHLKEWEKKQKRLSERNLPPEDLLPPIVDFEALFIPDDVKAVGQIAPMLAYNDISGIRLLGTNLWNSSSLIKRGQQMVENALFVDSYIPNETEMKQYPFVQEYLAVFNEKPTNFEIQAYDAGKILRSVLDRGASSRTGVISYLNEVKELPGAIGPITVTKYREFMRPLVAMTVSNGQIQQVLSRRKP